MIEVKDENRHVDNRRIKLESSSPLVVDLTSSPDLKPVQKTMTDFFSEVTQTEVAGPLHSNNDDDDDLNYEDCDEDDDDEGTEEEIDLNEWNLDKMKEMLENKKDELKPNPNSRPYNSRTIKFLNEVIEISNLTEPEGVLDPKKCVEEVPLINSPEYQQLVKEIKALLARRSNTQVRVKCPVNECDVLKDRLQNFIHHIRHAHLSNSPFNCVKCPYTSDRKVNVIHHAIAKHTGAYT